jgi:hypothetical protein
MRTYALKLLEKISHGLDRTVEVMDQQQKNIEDTSAILGREKHSSRVHRPGPAKSTNSSPR